MARDLRLLLSRLRKAGGVGPRFAEYGYGFYIGREETGKTVTGGI
jgi:hypothetical protein